MLFKDLFTEAERSGYLLGSHSAREGESVRGMPRQSTIADIGFYNRDPEDDVKHPSTPTPQAVKATFSVIADSFKKLMDKDNKESKDKFVDVITPYVIDWNVIKSKIPTLNTLLQRKASLERTLRVATPKSEDRIIAMLEKVNEQISDVTKVIERSAEFVKTNEEIILSKLVQILLDVTDNKEALKNASDRYFSTVNYRKQEAENLGNMNYLTISPVISLMRFFNNTVDQVSRSTDAVKALKTHRSSRNVMQQLQSIPNAQDLIDLYNLVKSVAPELRDNPDYISNTDYKINKQKANRLALNLKTKLPENVFHSILINLNNFFSLKEGSEGALMNVLLNIAPRALLK